MHPWLRMPPTRPGGPHSPRGGGSPHSWGAPQGRGSPQRRGSQRLSPSGTGLAARVLAGCTTGAVAVTCAQPTDVVKVRFQANGALPDCARRYSGTVDAYRTIAREEGVRGLWRGRGRQGQGGDEGGLGNRDGDGGGWGTHPGCSRRGM